jgi:pimeloyl-ACP methyl ester carboxylesterase
MTNRDSSNAIPIHGVITTPKRETRNSKSIFVEMRRKKFWRWLRIILAIYIAIGTILYFFQDNLLFHPEKIKKENSYTIAEPHNEFNIPVNEESNISIVQFLSPGPTIKGAILYFHGNRKNISWYSKYAPYLTKNDYEVWMIDYPGFGKSTGTFSENTLYDWAMQLYKLVHARFSEDSIIIYGKSFGTGIATELASKVSCKRLILETPYYDFPAVAKQYLFIYPIDNMLHYKFPTYRYLQQVKAPVTIIHGTGDWVISYNNAKRLLPFLKSGDEFVTIKNGSHNNLFGFKKTVRVIDSVLAVQ